MIKPYFIQKQHEHLVWILQQPVVALEMTRPCDGNSSQ